MTAQPIPLHGETLLVREPVTIIDPQNPIEAARKFVADKFTDSQKLRTLHRHRGAFWQFHGSHYSVANDENIRACAWTFCEKAMCERKKLLVPLKPTRSLILEITSALEAVVALDDHIAPPAWLGDASDLPPAEEFFAVANGLLHLPSGELYRPTPEYFCLAASDVTFDAQAPEPKHWLAFMGQLFGDDREAIDLLQEWCGYALTTDTSQQKILLVVGPKRSGKGTVARVLTGLLGHDGVVAPTLAGLSSNFGLEPLIGKPLAIISDARVSGRSDQAAIAERLLSISGEDDQTIDRKHRQAWTGRLSTRFVILTNELPRLTDASGALTGRFSMLLLKQSFYGREDPGLTARLLGELPGILNWARQGYIRLRERGFFQQPESAVEAISDLEALSSPVTAFVRDRCKLGAGRTVLVADLFDAWHRWCTDNGRREPGIVQVFSRDLRAAFPGITTKQKRDGEDSKPIRKFEGISLL